ncbi:MAG TPA: 4-alpha-glucanotransferase [Pyrinomonadaceae bacterium]|nr:4-alpha-glucanotransferase [Pyrinomonadaceae bacterium]
MDFPRASGILLHPTSLPGPLPIGDLGPEAFAFIDFLNASGQTFWQTLPLGPVGYGGSPYASYSAFAGNTLLISPQVLVDEKLLDESDLPAIESTISVRTDFELAETLKNDLLAKAYVRFQESPNSAGSEFENFKQAEGEWLDDYALFQSLKGANRGASWHEWDEPLRKRDASELSRARSRLCDQIEAQKFFQFLFFRQWFALKTYAHNRGVKLIGDLPIFVAHDSADVWIHPHLFKLTPAGLPTVVAGVPPDYFSATGQFWGNPLYDWETMKAEGFSWWIARARQALRISDAVRFDHFRGFSACWEIPAGDKTAEGGAWVEASGRELFLAMRDALGDLPIIAEDLGVITPDVDALRAEFGFPGMRVLQFGFGGDAEDRNLPHNYPWNAVVYTGTHDNNTTVGWFRDDSLPDSTRDANAVKREREFSLEYLDSNGHEIHWDFIRSALSSVANTAVIPLQDVLGLGTEARMNVPNSSEGNWAWRFPAGSLTEELAARLKNLTQLYGR